MNKYLNDGQLEIAFLGGCGEFGMNLTCYAYNDHMVVVDCGVMFAPERFIGVDAIIPNVDDHFKIYGGPAAYIFTHGHEDHVGALPLLIKKWPAPIFASPWTTKIIHGKLPYHGIKAADLDITEIGPGDKVANGDFSFEFFHVNHSIPMTCSLGITTPEQRIFHTGDFKFDPAPPFEPPADYSGIQTWAAAGVDYVIADSTNAPTAGWGKSESSVTDKLEAALKALQSRIIISTFSSNFWRLLSCLELAKRLDRKVAFVGSGMTRCMDFGTKLGLLPSKLRSYMITDDEADFLPRNQLILVASGCQAEHRSALHRIVQNEHNKFKLEANDTIVFSSRVIPGNEKQLAHLIAECHKKGCQVITTRSQPEIHVSGHAHSEEIDHLLGLTQPKNFIAVHGTNTQIMANVAIGEKRGINSIAAENGTFLRIGKSGEVKYHTYEQEPLFVDSWSKNPMNYEDLRRRHKIGDSGLIVVKGLYDRDEELWRVPLTIDNHGVGYPQDFNHPAWLGSVTKAIEQALVNADLEDLTNVQTQLANRVRKMATKFLVKKPVVMVHVYVA